MADKKHRFEPSIKVALREQAKHSYHMEEDVLDSPNDDEVIREFDSMVDHDED